MPWLLKNFLKGSYEKLLFQVFDDSRINFGSLPSALRRVMVKKFPDFDTYQLGKYRGKGTNKKRKKNIKKQINSTTDEKVC